MATYYEQMQKNFTSLSEACKSLSGLKRGLDFLDEVHDFETLQAATSSTRTSQFGWDESVEEFFLTYYDPDGEFSLSFCGDEKEVKVTLAFFYYHEYRDYKKGGDAYLLHQGEVIILDDWWHRTVESYEYWAEQGDLFAAAQAFKESGNLRDLQLQLEWSYDRFGCKSLAAWLDPQSAMVCLTSAYVEAEAVAKAAEAELRREFSFRHVPEAEQPLLRAYVTMYRNALGALLVYCEE